MVTEKQLITNRESAKKSRVKTSRGRAIIRLNDLKFGLFAGDLLLPSEDAEVLVEIWESVWAELKPQGILEEMINDSSGYFV